MATERGNEPVATPARTREDADKGVAEIVDLMTRGLWVSGPSHVEIAEKHGVSPATVKGWATSASRVIRAVMDADKDELRARMRAMLETVVHKAMTTRDVFTTGTNEKGCMVAEFRDAPNLNAAVSAIELQAKLLGLITNKHDVTTRPSVGHLSREQHAEALKKLSDEIAAEQARLEEEAIAEGEPR